MEKSYEAPKLLVEEGKISKSIAAGIASAITGSATSSTTSSSSSCTCFKFSQVAELSPERTLVRVEQLSCQEVVEKTEIAKSLIPPDHVKRP